LFKEKEAKIRETQMCKGSETSPTMVRGEENKEGYSGMGV